MIKTSNPTCINGESLKEWLSDFVGDSVTQDMVFLCPDKPWDCTSQSRAFATVDIDAPLSKAELLKKMAPCSNSKFAYFYIHDAVMAALGAGLLQETYYHVLLEG
jgi:hypothetical protein